MPQKSNWVTTSVAARELGCTAKFLREQRDKLFKLGRHYRSLNPHAWRPTYRWHLKRCQQLMGSEGATEE